MVIWIIGLSRAGKTTLSKLLYEKLKPNTKNLVLLDGDIMRNLFKNDVDHTIEGRFKNAERLSHLTKFLADQKIHVIGAVLSIFPEWQKWNRLNIDDYQEVYVKTSIDVLEKRDKNNLYLNAKLGKIKNVVGVDIPFPEPLNADLIIENNLKRSDFSTMINKILSLDAIKNLSK